MVRAETAAASVELFADGDMQVTYQRHESRARESDMCDVDYPLGTEGTCDCVDSTNHQIILQEEMCIQAAKEAGVSTPVGNFRLTPEWTNHHPKGCFKDTCNSDPKGQCYFFNPIGGLPAQCQTPKEMVLLNGDASPEVTGVPVCRRAKYLNGTVNANGVCPMAGYGVIMNENNCSEAAMCLGDGTGIEFRPDVLDASKHDLYPLGCFIDSTDGKVYYNAPIAGRSTTTHPPTNPVGTPICNVTVRTRINFGEASGTTNVEDRATASTCTPTTPEPPTTTGTGDCSQIACPTGCHLMSGDNGPKKCTGDQDSCDVPTCCAQR